MLLSNVRSRHELMVRLGPGLNILAGPNGAGKTTVLEAAALVLRGTMLRSGMVRDLIKRGEDFLRIELDLDLDRVTMAATAAYSRAGERRLAADGAPLDDLSRWRDVLPVRSFVPDDLRLIKGSPRRRREYLDELAGRCEPEYAPTLRQYDQALGQRNALLRSRFTSDDAGQFVPWERILARTGLQVSALRAAALARFVDAFQRTHAVLSGEEPDSVRLVYRTNVADLDEGAYEARLADNRGADQQRTFTHLGPHRDDLRLTRRGLDMRECASQGEQRTAILALVMAEWAYRGDCARPALLLLDDVMSELDEERRRALVAMIGGRGQTIVTTTDLRYFTAGELDAATVIELTQGTGDTSVGVG
jgi:DNA replication and repair protein RecF